MPILDLFEDIVQFHRPRGFESKFRAYRSAVQAIPSGALTQIQFDITQFDPLGEFDIAVTYAFIPIQTGYYYISTQAHFVALPVGTTIEIMLYINAGTVGHKFTDTLATLPDVIDYSALYYMVAGDTFTVSVRQNTGINRNLQPGTFDTSIQGFRVG